MKMNDKVVSGGPQVADLFAERFSSVYALSSVPTTNTNTVTNLPDSSTSMISTIKLLKTDVLLKIKGLNTQKGAGPDNIPPLFVKRCGRVLSFPLAMIFNLSLKTGIFPDEWKRTRIVPILKKGDVSEVGNYRPISILACFAKLFESLIYPVIYRHLNSSLSEFQHGFRSGRSVESSLISFVSEIATGLDKGLQMDAIYTDMSSAFDKVDHNILLSKLRHYGVGNILLQWFGSYLNDRPQIVVVNGAQSQVYYARTGVPQGSHLGPILFLTFINDIVTHVRGSKVSLYADDFKIYRLIKKPEDAYVLQSDLDNIARWCINNGMVLNHNKCFHISFTKKIRPIISTYKINGEQLTKKNEIRDLGVTLDSKLRFNAHIDNVVKKATWMMGFIRRNARNFKQSNTKIILYCSLVRSHLEFASVVWSPTYNEPSQRVERIQRSFTRYLAFASPNFSHRRPYDQRLKHFKLFTLRKRRIVADMTFLHKIINHAISCPAILECVKLSVPYNRPRSRITRLFSVPPHRTNIGLHNPLSRMSSQYNLISERQPELDIFNDSLNIFKKKLLAQLS